MKETWPRRVTKLANNARLPTPRAQAFRADLLLQTFEGERAWTNPPRRKISRVFKNGTTPFFLVFLPHSPVRAQLPDPLHSGSIAN